MSIHPVPLFEITINFARASGPGGQNVNKTATKVVVHWQVGTSQAFSLEQKERIRHKLANRLNSRDELVIASEQTRSQSKNREAAIKRLNQLVAEALKKPKTRQKTMPTKASAIRRGENKRRTSLVKKLRHTFEW